MIGKISFIFFLFPTVVVAKTISAYVPRVIDGDTFIVQYQDHEERVRLLSIDAPELDQVHGIQSKKALESYVLNENILLEMNEELSKDKYGRTLANVNLGNLNVIRPAA